MPLPAQVALVLLTSVTLAAVIALYLRTRKSFLQKVSHLQSQLGRLHSEHEATTDAREDALHRQMWYRDSLAASPNIVFAYDLGADAMPGKFTDASDAACEALGYSREQLLAMSPPDIETYKSGVGGATMDVQFGSLSNTDGMATDLSYARRNMQMLMRHILREGTVDYDGGYIAHDGRLVPVRVNARSVTSGSRTRIISFARDLAEDQQLQQQLTALQQFLDALLKESVWGVAIFDGDRKPKKVNAACLKMFGCPDEHAFRRFQFFENRFFPDAAKAQINRGGSCRSEMVVDFDQATKEGLYTASRSGVGHFDLGITSLGVSRDFGERGYLLQVQDITPLRRAENELEKMEEALRQAKKMEAIGTLAGGIAHDFNNILTPIVGYAELGQDLCPEDSPLHGFLRDILASGLRAKQLVEQILVFSRRGERTGKPMRLKPIIKEVTKQVGTSLPDSIKVNCAIRTDEDQVLATPTQIHQVLMNLCSNAAYVMRETGGSLDITLSSFVLGHMHKREFPQLATRKYLRGGRRERYVRITVRDTGPGMDEETARKVFEPFFTTKPSGEGTGMGLPLVQGIATALGGALRLESVPGEGTTFHVALPAVEEDKRAAAALDSAPLPTGGGRVLFVDDEPTIVQLAERMLTSLGYDPVVTNRSPEALRIFERDPQGFDIVVTDQVMPEMTGADLTKSMLALRPDLPIVLCTGFSEKFPREEAEAAGIREFVMKPIVRRDLAEALARALSPVPVPVEPVEGDNEPADAQQ